MCYAGLEEIVDQPEYHRNAPKGSDDCIAEVVDSDQIEQEDEDRALSQRKENQESGGFNKEALCA